MKLLTHVLVTLALFGAASAARADEAKEQVAATGTVQVLDDTGELCGSEMEAQEYVVAVVQSRMQAAGLSTEGAKIVVVGGSFCRPPMAVRVSVTIAAMQQEAGKIRSILIDELGFTNKPAPSTGSAVPNTAVAAPKQ